MGPANCAVVGCYNSTGRLKKWKESICEVHEQQKQLCGCHQEPPFRLFLFPSIKRYGHKRDEWIRVLKRQTADKKPWTPCGSDRVCSDHFVDGEPTVQYPNPTLKLGYEQTPMQPRRQLFRKAYVTRAKKNESETFTSPAEVRTLQNEPLPQPMVQILSHQLHQIIAIVQLVSILNVKLVWIKII